MGVHDLWSIIEPVRESVPLYSLSGKTLAVDLSLWVCEAQHVQAMMGRVTKPHLRNLFFRVSSLTLMGVKLVFVVEGEAPKLKAETMSKRTQTRFGGFKKTAAAKCATNTSRGRFKAVLRECTGMLDCLGVPWVTAAGEAEAMCAYLDSQGLVDGCITNDGDAFLYGAQTVYRNFNMNSKDPQVDCYQTSRVQSQLRLCRENLVGLAILLGCDYIPKGIPGVGKEQALKILQTLKGETLLQKFDRWKDSNAGVSEGFAKKVPHCHICRHPGSAKTHERGGCLLCNSKHFCQPQDFDYQCPCDWHHYESRRQALSLEENVKKKTLASQHFPFTEIINEFMIAKDKPVSHFKRRRPNMLLMQKFAYEKMEWPKHYTSEKVLVLMTYVELMNRKLGSVSSSQIKPLRIVKPRVRNAVACFEVIWSTPEHYVFPDDHPAEAQHEVRTIEEESLFCVAFPEVVERYQKDKTLDKTKKKKTKAKKEKPADVSDGFSDVFAQMSLGSAPAHPQALPASISNTQEAKVEASDAPVNQKEERGLAVCPITPVSRTESEDAASASFSAVVDALHLSDIDWDAPSFTSSPPPQTATSHTADPKRNKATETEGRSLKQTPSSAPEPCYTDCSLRDRVLMKNASKAVNQKKENDMSYKLPSLEHLPNYDLDTKPYGQMSCNNNNSSKSTGKKADVTKTEPNAYKGHRSMKTKISQQPKMSMQNLSKAKDQCNETQHKSVPTAVPSFAVQPERCSSDSGQSDKEKKKSSKKTVCVSVCSSSDDSDAENRHSGPQRAAHVNPATRTKPRFIADFPLKPLSGPTAARTSRSATRRPQPSGPKPQKRCADAEIRLPTAASGSRGRDAAAAEGELLPAPSSPVTVSDSDDSVVCSDSPLPLAERLRLKFQK
ncbi:flap endonuclease GEN homolog 1 [Betta splendens]|uniref:Flap endonuclease GEN homolog 1 n=1 Tax=Betta splendens TaxID=158456 RepID=A0A6P7LTD0_BETSP|nr:flap endonuclease GEN homolog 1 [Betta splendens]